MSVDSLPNVVSRGSNKKPVSSEALATFFESTAAPQGGHLTIGYPVTTVSEERGPLDAVYVSPGTGVVAFDIVEGNSLGDYQTRQDDVFTRLEVRLKSHSALVERRNLKVDLHTITFAPAVAHVPEDSAYPVANTATISEVLSRMVKASPLPEVHERALSALQSMSSIRRTGTARPVRRDDSRGAILKRLEDSIATLDADQSHAVIETADDVQRIRGLAGSGKTVVLALKAAYLHAQHPDWRIAVTFNTRSLRDQFRRFINNFTIDQTGDEPDWSMVDIVQAWGASGGGNREGMYHRYCVENGATYYDFTAGKAMFGAHDALGGVCELALGEAQASKPMYDAILVDEAQDLPPAFLRMCYDMLRDKKRLVYAYDELQTLNGKGLPPAEEIFGVTSAGQPSVDFSGKEGRRRDIILEKCYRNSRPVLVTAHALGFGIYKKPSPPASTGIVQIFEQKDLWTDVGYRVSQGELSDGRHVRLERDADSSPKFLEEHSPTSDLLTFEVFDSVGEQNEWIANEIQRNLIEDELVANDIIVINPNPFTTRTNLGPVRKALMSRDIQSHIAGVDVGADIFFKPDERSVTFTGIYRAKGNEAAMIYVANAHEDFTSKQNQARTRNRLFTAITRSKGWVRVTGVGPEMRELVEEFNTIKASAFALDFVYPTAEERTTMQILHREVPPEVQKKVRGHDTSLDRLVRDLESGSFYREDLDPATLARLEALLRHE
ncbi:ATP-binding domain-containing protein [Pseudarthrobacter sp. AL07]|uniref:DEAD/DEAH box helicase n=1 Tax=unclassified Pseudarthrobacter TaxID=2647000 RepID=UPI00249BF46E|nr:MULTISPECIES: ATP-binding domain-containing protein [unclassified Pseudarthrobacter]MDI3194258.1 ATP-binding domain-containing protein [Pseudarthrobacter sp. AL20]MDI3208325.1 ATP-binding domain-containing protein [Pseudarthrobacter sp. AL07]